MSSDLSWCRQNAPGVVEAPLTPRELHMPGGVPQGPSCCTSRYSPPLKQERSCWTVSCFYPLDFCSESVMDNLRVSFTQNVLHLHLLFLRSNGFICKITTCCEVIWKGSHETNWLWPPRFPPKSDSRACRVKQDGMRQTALRGELICLLWG